MIHILQDTREKNAWGFEFYDCEVERTKIKYGDYAIKGMENKVRIERKASTGELFTNLCTTIGWRRFKKEMSSLHEEIGEVYILCEFPQIYMTTFPENSGIPKMITKQGKKVDNWKNKNAKFLRLRMNELKDDFGVKIIYCDSASNAESIAYKILKETYDKDRKSS